MYYKIFTISLINHSEDVEDLNKFINTKRIISIDKHIIQKDNNSYISFIIEYDKKDNQNDFKITTKKPKVDYKEVLNQTDFVIFSKLRDIRKEIADKEGIPVYNVFTNEQLAEIVKNKVNTKTDLSKIPGVGEAKMDKYADKILEFMKGLEI